MTTVLDHAQLPDPVPRGPAAQRLLDALEHQLSIGSAPPPCSAALTGRDLWFSDNPWTRRDAATLCRQECHVLDECGAAADERHEVHGVWGGKPRQRHIGLHFPETHGGKHPSP